MAPHSEAKWLREPLVHFTANRDLRHTLVERAARSNHRPNRRPSRFTEAESPDAPAELAPLGSAFAQTSDSADSLTEVVVTAQKRSENVQNVPIAVTAVTGEELRKQGVIDIMALQNVAPGVQVSTGVLGPQINIRGITSTNSTEVGDRRRLAATSDSVRGNP